LTRIVICILFSMFMTGCPLEDDCTKVMQCEDDVEMLCEKSDSGCGENCHYYVYDHCYEICK